MGHRGIFMIDASNSSEPEDHARPGVRVREQFRNSVSDFLGPQSRRVYGRGIEGRVIGGFHLGMQEVDLGGAPDIPQTLHRA